MSNTAALGHPAGRDARAGLRRAAAGLRENTQSPSEHGVTGRHTPCLFVAAVNQDRPARSADTEGPDTPTAGPACGHRSFGPPGDVDRRNCGRVMSYGHCGSSPAGQLAAEPSTGTAPRPCRR